MMMANAKRILLFSIQFLVAIAILYMFHVDEWIWSQAAKTTDHAKYHRAKIRRERSVHKHSKHHLLTQDAPETLVHQEKFDAICNIQIVETVPEVLRQKGYAKPTSIKHLQTHKVS